MESGTHRTANCCDESSCSLGPVSSLPRSKMKLRPRRIRQGMDRSRSHGLARIAAKELWFSWRPSPDKPGRRHDPHPFLNVIDRFSATPDHDADARPTRNRRDLRPVVHLWMAALPPPTRGVGPFLSNADGPLLPAVRIDVVHAEAKTPMQRVHRDFVQPEF